MSYIWNFLEILGPNCNFKSTKMQCKFEIRGQSVIFKKLKIFGGLDCILDFLLKSRPITLCHVAMTLSLSIFFLSFLFFSLQLFPPYILN